MSDEEQISAADCARRRGVSKWTIVRALMRGTIPGKKVGKVWITTVKDCEAYEISEAHRKAGLANKRGASRRWTDRAGKEEEA